MNSRVTHVLVPAVAIGWNGSWGEEINEIVSVGVIAGAEKFEGKFSFSFSVWLSALRILTSMEQKIFSFRLSIMQH